MGAMGLANLGYITLALLAAVGFVALLHAQIAKRHRLARPALVALVIGLLGLFLWGVFLSGLKDALGDARRDGEYALRMLEQERLAARLRGIAEPNPDPARVQAVAAMEAAKRNAQVFGWDWAEIGPKPQAPQPDRQPSTR